MSEQSLNYETEKDKFLLHLKSDAVIPEKYLATIIMNRFMKRNHIRLSYQDLNAIFEPEFGERIIESQIDDAIDIINTDIKHTGKVIRVSCLSDTRGFVFRIKNS